MPKGRPHLSRRQPEINESNRAKRALRQVHLAPRRANAKLLKTRHYTHLAACYHLLHGVGIIHGRVLRACAAPARESTLTLFSIRGASIERHTDRVFRVVCTEPKQLSFVGQRLFSPALSRICQVTSTSGIAEVRCGLPVIRPEPRNLESLVSALFGERLGDLAQLRMSRHCPDFTRQALPEMPFYRPLAEDTDRPERLNE